MVSASSACGNCAFFDEHHGNSAAATQDGGLCRFNPPVTQPTADAHGLWPVVSEKDWCGHFAPETAGGMTAAE
ncbi:hypothetical protein D3273_10535 [Lichenibacterium minor]|jgi:hypothetical protein|uniref:Uncharacterized protein n=1 Tax=Lichenibacterium minor TaxID=2316528 RepID=A0A4Q2UAP3_9HYPH|nr:hypothetical protein [Lichenibacterium minor]RYC32146.1 hypothetical protein D3273_10535 [Lichenibacterium minor]